MRRNDRLVDANANVHNNCMHVRYFPMRTKRFSSERLNILTLSTNVLLAL